MKTMPVVESVPDDWSERPFVDYLCEVDRLLHELYGITSSTTTIQVMLGRR